MSQSLATESPAQEKPSIELADLFEAYADCRINKRNIMNALAFELDYESKLISLCEEFVHDKNNFVVPAQAGTHVWKHAVPRLAWIPAYAGMTLKNCHVLRCEEINDGTYQIGRSIAFIVDKPVKREIFAADFRDRVVHHLIINKLSPLFEKDFICDSYACREGRGSRFGIQRVSRFIGQCSQNYTKDCYVLNQRSFEKYNLSLHLRLVLPFRNWDWLNPSHH